MHQCKVKGCGQFSRTMRDVIDHELNDFHCEECGWGMSDPLGVLKRFRESKDFKWCEACDFMQSNSIPKANKNKNAPK